MNRYADATPITPVGIPLVMLRLRNHNATMRAAVLLLVLAVPACCSELPSPAQPALTSASGRPAAAQQQAVRCPAGLEQGGRRQREGRSDDAVRAYSAVLHSPDGDAAIQPLLDLSLSYPPALMALAERRKELELELTAQPVAKEGVQLYAKLNRLLGEFERGVQVLSALRHANSVENANRLGMELLEDLWRAKRYAEIVAGVGPGVRDDLERKVQGDLMSMATGNPHVRFPNAYGMYFEALLAEGDEGGAEAIAQPLTENWPVPPVYDALVRHAARAGATEYVRRLCRVARSRLAQKDGAFLTRICPSEEHQPSPPLSSALPARK